MTTIVIPDASEERLLDLITNVGYTLGLYQNDATAGLTVAQQKLLVTANFTAATFTGYAAKTLTAGSWVTTALADPSTAVYAQQTFTRTSTGATQNIYGYFITRTSDGVLVLFQQFPGPVATTTNGDSIQITPTMTLSDDQEATVAARGIVAGPQTITTTTSTYTTDSVTDFALSNFDADGTRNYRVHMTSDWSGSAATGIWVIRLTIDGSDYARMGTISTDGTIIDGQVSMAVPWQPVTGQYDLAIRMDEVSGSVNMALHATSTEPRMFWIEDCGPR